jgi:hypothetical protein
MAVGNIFFTVSVLRSLVHGFQGSKDTRSIPRIEENLTCVDISVLDAVCLLPRLVWP